MLLDALPHQQTTIGYRHPTKRLVPAAKLRDEIDAIEKLKLENDQAVGAMIVAAFYTLYTLRKQLVSRDEFERILAAPNRYFWDYPNDYGLLKLFKSPIRWLGRAAIPCEASGILTSAVSTLSAFSA